MTIVNDPRQTEVQLGENSNQLLLEHRFTVAAMKENKYSWAEAPISCSVVVELTIA